MPRAGATARTGGGTVAPAAVAAATAVAAAAAIAAAAAAPVRVVVSQGSEFGECRLAHWSVPGVRIGQVQWLLRVPQPRLLLAAAVAASAARRRRALQVLVRRQHADRMR